MINSFISIYFVPGKNEISDGLNQLQMLSYSGEVIDATKQGEVEDLDETFSQSMEIAIQNPQLVEELYKKMSVIRDSKD